jgi:glycerophosphoryl diester phosphodiesterase
MKIIAHRGFWTREDEKNTKIAFDRALSHGFGIETDVRDLNGELVIAHDAFAQDAELFTDFYENVKNHHVSIAVNVKADGLSQAFSELLSERQKADFVFFDMSGPEHFRYLEKNLHTLNRISDYEQPFNFPDSRSDVWLDAFKSEKVQTNWLEQQLDLDGRVFIVSPELHGRDHEELWAKIRLIGDSPQYYLCTDFPLEAANYFGGYGD